MQSKEAMIKDIRDTVQFAMVVLIFFSTLIYGALRAAGIADSEANAESLLWGVGVAFQIGNYFLIALMGPHLSVGWLKWIKGLLIFGILALIDPIIVGAVYYKSPLSWFPKWLFLGCFVTAFVMPIAVCILTVIGAYWMEIPSVIRFVRKHHK